VPPRTRPSATAAQRKCDLVISDEEGVRLARSAKLERSIGAVGEKNGAEGARQNMQVKLG
jgi:hypothetical protein